MAVTVGDVRTYSFSFTPIAMYPSRQKASESASGNPVLPVTRRESTQLDRLVEHLANLIESRGFEPYHVIPNISACLFEDCKTRLLNHPNRKVASYFDESLFYEYDANLERLIITCETREHEITTTILEYIKEVVRQKTPSSWGEILSTRGTPLTKLEISGDFKPDGMLTFRGRGTIFPVIVIEIAHSQPEEELLGKGTIWLKVFRLHEDDHKMWIDRWGPKIIWKSDGPLPDPDRSLELSMEDIFGERINELPLDHEYQSLTIPIPLRDLWSWCTLSIHDLRLVPREQSVKFFQDELSEKTDQEPPTTSDSELEREELDSDYKNDSGKVGSK
ncbi:MAG: hypothetical protein M1813_000860 [Trichoglossum hirsutum]|nr:MAG: hypothetical protein M1813_000860 [Trichoglossum hirsutum]